MDHQLSAGSLCLALKDVTEPFLDLCCYSRFHFCCLLCIFISVSFFCRAASIRPTLPHPKIFYSTLIWNREKQQISTFKGVKWLKVWNIWLINVSNQRLSNFLYHVPPQKRPATDSRHRRLIKNPSSFGRKMISDILSFWNINFTSTFQSYSQMYVNERDNVSGWCWNKIFQAMQIF